MTMTLAKIIRQARLLERAGRADEALAMVRSHRVDGVPDEVRLLTLLGRLEMGAGNLESAVEAMERAVALAPDSVATWIDLAKAVAHLHGGAAQVAVLDRAGAAVGFHPRLARMTIKSLLAKGKAVEAEAVMTQALDLAPRDRGLLTAVLAHRLRRGRREGLNDLLDRLVATGDMPTSIRLLLARWLEREGDVGEAAGAYRALALHDPTSPHAHATLARLAALALDGGEARRQLEVAVQCGRGRYSILGEIINEMRVHSAEVARGREAVARGDVQGLLTAIAREPGSTAMCNALLRMLRTQGRLSKAAPTGDIVIPRHIHQFWDSAAVPPDVREVMESWQAANPGWHHTAHDLVSAKAYLVSLDRADIVLAWRRARTAAQKADILRLALLFHQGGVYADADDRCLGPLEPLLGAADLVLFHEPFGSVGNNFIAAAPGHPVIGAALNQAVEATLSGGAETIWLRTGPGAMTRALALYLAEQPLRVDQMSEGRILVLDGIDLGRTVWVHCKLDYKVSGKSWMDSDFSAEKAV